MGTLYPASSRARIQRRRWLCCGSGSHAWRSGAGSHARRSRPEVGGRRRLNRERTGGGRPSTRALRARICSITHASVFVLGLKCRLRTALPNRWSVGWSFFDDGMTCVPACRAPAVGSSGLAAGSSMITAITTALACS